MITSMWAVLVIGFILGFMFGLIVIALCTASGYESRLEEMNANKQQEESKDKLSELHKSFFKQLSLNSEIESYDDSWGMSTECEVLSSNNPDAEISIVDDKLIDLFHQIKDFKGDLKWPHLKNQ